MPFRLPGRPFSARAGWRPFLTGVALALVLIAMVGTAMAHPPHGAPFDARPRSAVTNDAVVDCDIRRDAMPPRYVDAFAAAAGR